MIALKLSKAGYGKAQDILDSRLDVVMGMIAFEQFSTEYEERVLEMNRED